MDHKTQPHPSTASTESTRLLYRHWREGFVTPLLIGTMVIGLFALIPALISSQNIYLNAVFIGVYLAVGFVTFARLPYAVRVSVFLLTLYALGLSELFSTGILGDSIFFFLTFIVLSTMMFSPRLGMAATLISIGTLAVMGGLYLTGTISAANPNSLSASLTDWLSAGFTSLLFSVVITLGFRRLELEFSNAQRQVDEGVEALKQERNNLEKNVSDRTRQLRQVNEISRAISSILDPEELLTHIVQLIGQELDCYHTAIFLLDSTNQWVELKEATGDAGRTLRENKYRFAANGRNMIAAAIQMRQPRIALDTGDDPVKFDNPLLRYTRSEVALPLILGDRVVGALDLQSTKGIAFSPQDLDALQNMANQVSISLENARLFREASQSLTEMRATQRQYIQSAWTTLASEQQLEYHLGDGMNTDQTKEMEVSIALRDQIIGQISLATDEEWTPEQRNLIEAIATQAALALENARLVEESQSMAAYERLTNEITAKIWSSTSVDAILQTAVRELGRVLDVTEAVIELKMEDNKENGK